MPEFIFDVVIRPAVPPRQRWEALVPALPGLVAEASSDMEAFEGLQTLIVPFLAERLARGEGVPRQSRAGHYMDRYGLVFWQFLRVRLGPRRADQRVVEPIFPDIDDLLTDLEGGGREE
ncbi:MAG: hypothetical protein CMN25_01705 [Salinicola sp.]|uniref:hypothetical protein n=1 Tax=uncultured Salinicola sp. TaxID=1193542 RepID=UPI000C986FDB|nr:hypothetical protein [uncultured Salinicola sp.]MAM56031.1 hypothetical protein [Salinicola sp.]